MDEQISISFSFNDPFTGENHHFNKSFDTDEADVSWPDLFYHFERFINMVYGYSVKDKVALAVNPQVETRWDGLTFATEDENEEFYGQFSSAVSFGGTSE
jgi:hypothetical protein